MADQKISELTALTGANLADVDAFAVVDTSAVQTKKITYAELKTALDTGTGFVRITGDTMTGNLSFGDDNKIILGGGSDLQIYHDGDDSIITDTGTGNLIVKTNGNNIQFEDGSGNDIFKVTPTQTNIYHGTSGIKLTTTSTGIDVTGNATFADNGKAIFGNDSDLQIFHNGNNSVVSDTGTGSLFLKGNGTVELQSALDNEAMLVATVNGAVTAYHNGSPKLATTATGIDVTGSITLDGAVSAGAITVDHTDGTDNISLTPTSTGGVVNVRNSSGTSVIALDGRNGQVGIDVTGTVTADGLTVDGDVTINSTFPRIFFYESDTTNLNSTLKVQGGSLLFQSLNDDGTGTTSHMAINNSTGDISFYEDTGTTAKFHWDAADERLGIGTTSPAAPLDVRTTHTVTDVTSANTNSTIAIGNTGAGNGVYNAIKFAANQQDMYIMSFNNSAQASRRIGFFLGSVAGDAVADERLSILGNGNVGIGTASPSSYNSKADDLVVATSSDTGISIISGTSSEGALVFGDGTTGGSPLMGRIRYNHSSNEMDFRVNNDTKMTIDASGKVGIGTINPSAKLHINGVDDAGATDLLKLTYDNSPADTGITFTDLNNVVKVRLDMDASDTNDFELSVGTDLRVYTGVTAASSANERLTILNGGNVGIGDTSPDRKLHVNSGATNVVAQFESTDTTAAIELKDNAGTAEIAAQGNDLVIMPAGTERMRIDSSGNVGIGEVPQTDLNTAYDHLQIGKPANIMGSGSSGGLWLNSGAFFNSAGSWEYLLSSETVSSFTMTNSIPFRFRYAAAGTAGNTFSWSEAARIDTSGNLLVGRDSVGNTGNGHTIRGGDSAIFSRDASGETMQVCRNASAGDIVRFLSNGNDKGSIDFDGSNTISYTSSSDQRLKENIADADDAGSKIDAIKVRKYDWKADGSHQDYGMIAQELQTVAPEAVSGDADSEKMMGVDYSKLVPMLIKEIQSLRARITTLEG